ncbi:MAG: ribosome silencing factor [bacterium]|nr:ribosome silencing factor [bacterium]
MKSTPKSAPKSAAKAAAPKAAPKKAANETHKLHDIVMKALDQDKGENIVSINLEGKSAIADYMVIVTGTSTRAVVGMAERLRERLGKEGVRARLEGQDTGDWVIVDAGDVIVHVFRAEVREFYNLEKLWSADFSTVDYTLYQST